MLESLKVKNLALIEEAEVEFQEGLNVLTGETGAGKSILIGSINLALGAKADKDFIRTGKEYAYVELVFYIEDEKVLKKAEEMEIYPEDNRFIISRKITQTKSTSKINGETVTIKQVKALSELLLDIHGQHEHQSLLKENKQREILDVYAANEILELKKQLKEQFSKYKEIKKQLEEENMDEEARKKELSLAEFEYQEIKEANLSAGEDEMLENSYKKMIHSQKIMEGLNFAATYTSNENGGVGNLVGRAVKELRAIEGYDEELEKLCGQLCEIEECLSDFNRNMHSYMQDMEFDEEEYRNTEERLNTINHLKAKYGNSLEDILSHQKKCEELIETLSNYELFRDSLLKQEQEVYNEVVKLCDKISEIRKKYAKDLEKEIQISLEEMNFLQVKFAINVKPQIQHISADGYDTVEMVISTNPGETMKPLSNVVSGGELSRIMLAIKTSLAAKDEIDTLIFDEIDTGISGKTAWLVSEKMGKLSKCHQLLCITHLPQIAARATEHLYIEKNVTDDTTVTGISVLSEEESIEELARMLGGICITEAVRNNAAEMKIMAKKEEI